MLTYVPGGFIDDNTQEKRHQRVKKRNRLHVFSELFGSLVKNSKADMNPNLKQKFSAA